MDMIPNSDYNP